MMMKKTLLSTYIGACELGFRESLYVLKSWQGVRGYEYRINEKNTIYLISELKKWFREEHKVFINIQHVSFDQTFRFTITGGYHDKNRGMLMNSHFNKYSTYEEALEEGLISALKLIGKEEVK